MPSQIADSPLTIEHGTDGPDDNPSEFVNFGDIDGDTLNVVADERGLYLMTSSELGAQFSTDDATTVAATILKLVAPPAGELALPLLAGVHKGAALGIVAKYAATHSGIEVPAEHTLLAGLGIALMSAERLGAKTGAEGLAMLVGALDAVGLSLTDTL